MPKKLEDCVKKVKAQGKDESSAYAICNDSLKESRKYEIEDKGDRLYIKSFLLDSSVNLNEWGVDEATLDQNINTYIGKPIVVQEDFDHPQSGDPNYDHHLNYQDRFRIGTIIDITQKDGIYSSIAEITDPDAREAIRQGNLPSYVSPQLFHDGVGKEPDDKAKTWRGTHLAIVKDPAYGVKKARITGQCSGEAGVCLAQLKKASCKFCIKKTIEAYKQAKTSFVDELTKLNIQNDKRIMNALVSNNTTKVSSLQTENLNNKSKLSEVKEETKQETVSIEEFNKVKQALDLVTKERDSFKEANEKLNNDYKSATERIDKIEFESRNEKVASILSGCYFKDDETRKSIHDSYVKSGMSYDEISQATEGLRHTKSANQETKLPQKSASVQEVPYWVRMAKQGGLL